MVWLEGVGALELLKGLMVVGCGRIFGQERKASSDRWCMLQGNAIVFGFGMILGLGVIVNNIRYVYNTVSIRTCIIWYFS